MNLKAGPNKIIVRPLPDDDTSGDSRVQMLDGDQGIVGKGTVESVGSGKCDSGTYLSEVVGTGDIILYFKKKATLLLDYGHVIEVQNILMIDHDNDR